MTTETLDSSAACGCTDFSLSRRRLLGATAATAGVLAAGQMFGDAFRQVAYGAARGNNVVVILSMRGGADGLSMVVPSTAADQAVLRKARPDIYVPSSSLIAGDGRFGLHPAFKPLEDMWNVSKNFAAVHAVGLPAPNRSHFDSMHEIEDGSVGGTVRTGWINRTVGLSSSAVAESAVQMGSVIQPQSLAGSAPVLGANQVTDLQIVTFDEAQASARRASLSRMWASDKAPAGNAMRAALTTSSNLGPLVSAVGRGGSANPLHVSSYPDGPLKTVLANTAALIRADVGARFVTVDYGNWDMHSGVGKPDNGWMNNQVTHLAGSLKAFMDDLGETASRVTVVTMSEFGRRVAQNGSGGLDHGWGNVMLLLGAGVQGGQVHGAWDGLGQLRDGDVTVQTNFQSVLWEVVRSRFTDLSGARASIFPGAEQKTVGAMT